MYATSFCIRIFAIEFLYYVYVYVCVCVLIINFLQKLTTTLYMYIHCTCTLYMYMYSVHVQCMCALREQFSMWFFSTTAFMFMFIDSCPLLTCTLLIITGSCD